MAVDLKEKQKVGLFLYRYKFLSQVQQIKDGAKLLVQSEEFDLK